MGKKKSRKNRRGAKWAQKKGPVDPWFVYLLECRDGSVYTGITTNVEKRFRLHRAGRGAAYTRAHPPKKILHFEKHRTRSAALRREAHIKNLTRAEKLMLVQKSASHS